MKEPVWISSSAIVAIHSKLIVEHGGIDGLRDPGLLSAGLARPQHLFTYTEEINIFDLAAAYAYGLAKNHPFIDGNKRIALAAIDVFLRINGYKLIAAEVEAVAKILNLAKGIEEQEELAVWIQENAQQM